MSGEKKPGLLQEEINKIKTLAKELKALRHRLVEMQVIKSRLEHEVDDDVDKKIKLDEKRKARNILWIKDFILAKKLVALAKQCIHEKHDWVSMRPKNEPENSGKVYSLECSYCGANSFALFFAESDSKNERFLTQEFSAAEKDELEKFKAQEELEKMEGYLGQDVLRREIKKVHKKLSILRLKQGRINDIFEAAQNESTKIAYAKTREIRKEIKENCQKSDDVERQLMTLQAKCKHKWTKNMDVFRIKCKICGVLAAAVQLQSGKGLNISTIPGQEVLPEDDPD